MMREREIGKDEDQEECFTYYLHIYLLTKIFKFIQIIHPPTFSF